MARPVGDPLELMPPRRRLLPALSPTGWGVVLMAVGLAASAYSLWHWVLR